MGTDAIKVGKSFSPGGILNCHQGRIAILGNSGSGKTYLARALNAVLERGIIHLDSLFWEFGGFDRKRSADQVQRDIASLMQGESWIVEGVFGDLAQAFFPRAELLIWLDVDWETCSASLLDRGSESAKWLTKTLAEERFRELFAWAAAYWQRQGSCSHSGHNSMFDLFQGEKIRFTERTSVNRYIAGGKAGLPVS